MSETTTVAAGHNMTAGETVDEEKMAQSLMVIIPEVETIIYDGNFCSLTSNILAEN